MRFGLFLFLFSLHSFAQHSAQPEKESNTDLRSGLSLFTVEDVKNEKTYWLERTPNLDYFLRKKEKGEEEVIRKVDSKEARKLDMDFSSRFLKIQYELEPSQSGCSVTLRLSMKGESQTICEKDDKKTQELKPFLRELISRF